MLSWKLFHVSFDRRLGMLDLGSSTSPSRRNLTIGMHAGVWKTELYTSHTRTINYTLSTRGFILILNNFREILHTNSALQIHHAQYAQPISSIIFLNTIQRRSRAPHKEITTATTLLGNSTEKCVGKTVPPAGIQTHHTVYPPQT